MKFDITNDSLLTIDELCQKLSISRSTLDRWRGIGNRSFSLEYLANRSDFEEVINFPKPTVVFGNSPRWSSNVINEWISTQQKIQEKAEQERRKKKPNNPFDF